MKKTVLMAMIIAVSATTSFAETTPAAASDTNNNATPNGQAAQMNDNNAATAPATDAASPAKPDTVKQETTPAEPAKIDCAMTYPKEQKHVPSNLVKKWGEYAALKAFTMQAGQLDNQLSELKKCFTEPGWDGFKKALDQSGNLKAIKKEDLHVSSSVSGTSSVQSTKDDQWAVMVPVSVIYKNEKHTINQNLKVNLVVERKEDGGFGVVQIIAAPQKDLQKIQQPAQESPAQTPTDAADDAPPTTPKGTPIETQQQAPETPAQQTSPE